MKRTILVLSMSIFMLVNMSFAQKPQMGPRGERGPRMQKMNFLELTDAQQQKIDKLHLEFQKSVSPLRDKTRTLNNEFKLMIVDEKISESGLKKQLEKIAVLRQELALKRATHQRQVRSLLTDEQKVKYDQHIISGPRAGKHGDAHKRPGMRR